MTLQPIGACIILLDKTKSKVLLGKRKNSYKVGFYGLPGGRLELGEELKACAKREVWEETNLRLNNIDYVSVVREAQEEKDFIHFVFASNNYQGELINKEPDKCEGWEWYPLDKLPENILLGHKLAIECYTNTYALIDWHTKGEIYESE